MTWPPKQIPRGFPLTVTDKGYVKTIGGRTRWIAGRVKPSEAIAAYHRKAASLTARSRPLVVTRSEGTGIITVNHLLNRYLAARQRDVNAGEFTPHAFAEYRIAAKRVDAVAGAMTTADWTPDTTQQLYDWLRAKWGTASAKRILSRFASACLYGEERGWCEPVRVGRTVLRKLAVGSKGRRAWNLFDAATICRIIEHQYDHALRAGKFRPTNIQFLAMLLLALNGGLGASELAALRRDSIDLRKGAIEQPRGKTAAEHCVPLWPETQSILELVLEQRPSDPLVFRTRYGRAWVQQCARTRNGRIVGANQVDSVQERFKSLCEDMGIRRSGVGFYKLKHVHATLADAAGDPHATFVLAGHKLPGSKGHYVTVGVERVRAVAEHVRQSLGINRLACLEPDAISRLRKPLPRTPAEVRAGRLTDTAAAPAGE